MFDTESLIRFGGLLLVFLAVYGQTGLFFCFFLPSGGLLFTTGIFISNGDLNDNFFIVCFILTIAAFLGNITGYWFGKKTGPLLYKRKDARFFKKSYLITAERFYNKYGGLALTAGLFFPIIRTFAPIVAGMISLNFSRFMLFTFVGSFLWVLTFISIGYLVGSIPALKNYLVYIVIAIIVFVTIPVVVRIIKEFRKGSTDKNKI
jgi:membrane-associated protein